MEDRQAEVIGSVSAMLAERAHRPGRPDRCGYLSPNFIEMPRLKLAEHFKSNQQKERPGGRSRVSCGESRC
jgi:hypothetical protein